MAAAAAKPNAVVFLREAVEIEMSVDEVVAHLCRDGSVLLPLADAATDDGEAQLLRVGPTVAGRSIGVPVEVRLGPRWTRGGAVAVPIRWESAVLGGLFPVLDGTLVFSRLGEDSTRLELEASYRPPLDAFGELLDRALLHRVAESTIRSFLRRMADTIHSSFEGDGGTSGRPAGQTTRRLSPDGNSADLHLVEPPRPDGTGEAEDF
jgi:hypothetical protein